VGVLDYMIIILATAGMGLILYNMRVTHGFGAGIKAIVSQGGDREAVYFGGKRLKPVVYVADEVVRDDTGTLGERLASLARSARVNVTYATSMFSVEKSRLLAYIEDEIKRAEFAYHATRHVRYSQRLKFLRNLYYEIVKTHTPYTYRYSVIVWVPDDDPAGEARAEAFKSMVEAEAGVRLERAPPSVLAALAPSESSPLTGRSGYAAILANVGEEPGVIIGRDPEGRLIVMDWPRDFETHVGVFGPTGRGKTVFLAGIAAQLGSRSENRLDPFAVIVVDPKGDLASLLEPVATRVHRVSPGDCIRVPRTTGVAGQLAEAIMASRPGVGVRACEGSLLERGLVVYDLSGLKNEDRDVAASLIIASLAIEASESLLPGRVVLVLDEAWRTNMAEARHFTLMLREGRSRLLHAVYATQSPADLPEGVLENTGTLIVFGGYTRAYTESARLLGIDDARRLLSLPLGTAIVRLKDSAPVEVRVLAFHEYVKREPPPRPQRHGGRVGGNGQEAKAAESGQRLANLQEPSTHTPGPGEVPAAHQGDPQGEGSGPDTRPRQVRAPSQGSPRER